MVTRLAAFVLVGATLAFATAKSALSTPADPTLKVTVSGKGTVTSTPTGIKCPKKCSAHFPHRLTGKARSTSGKGLELRLLVRRLPRLTQLRDQTRPRNDRAGNLQVEMTHISLAHTLAHTAVRRRG
jgi:hypothetical protein